MVLTEALPYKISRPIMREGKYKKKKERERDRRKETLKEK